MKTSTKWNYRSIGTKIMLGLVLAAMIGSIDVVPSYGDDGRNGKHYDRGHGHDRYEHRGRGHDRGSYYYVRGRRVYRPYVYTERVYVEPPVYYEPPPPPGISIFFPSIIIRP
jgi:hypothetical protein